MELFGLDTSKRDKRSWMEIIGKLRVFTEGRKNIFSDASKTGCRSAEDGQKLSLEAAEAFDEARKMIDDLQAALSEYINSSPAFISEFLAPEGIITKKREIDSKIADNIKLIAEINQIIKDLNASNVNLSMKIDDKFFDPKLIDALTLYHSLIQEKKIIPRENQLNTSGSTPKIIHFNSYN